MIRGHPQRVHEPLDRVTEVLVAPYLDQFGLRGFLPDGLLGSGGAINVSLLNRT